MLAGNLFLVGSLTDIIVVERAAAAGMRRICRPRALRPAENPRLDDPPSITVAMLWLLANGQMAS